MSDAFQRKVARQTERLGRESLQSLESEVVRKRIHWFKENCKYSELPDLPTPRTAFDLLFLEYMGLAQDDLAIISESEREIVWLSRNNCETLEACKALGLDTRTVCRAVYEKSTQAFISRVDPQLRFHRRYEEIRPHSSHCKESIIRIDFEQMMKKALEEAQLSRSEGNHCYGAIVLLGQEIIGRAHDTAVTDNDPSLHAEVNAIRQAVKTTGDHNLCGAILFSTCEPCPMCSSLVAWANLTTIVYGASIEETARLGKARIRISAKEIAEKSPAMIEVIGGVLHEECLALYS